MSANDAFDNLLNLEEKYYSEGYKQGVADGDRAGRVEGRSLGIEKGFEKFVEAGRLHGKSIVWANRLPRPQGPSAAAAESPTPVSGGRERLPALNGGGARLAKNIVTLYGLVEPDTLSTENTDEAVNDFDDRVKRAQGKARVIERHIGEDVAATSAGTKEGTPAKGGRAGGSGAAGGSQPSSSAATPSVEAGSS